MMHRTTRALALGLALALALPGAAFATTATSSTAATATVDSALSMSGVPATYALGHAVAGSTLAGPEFSIVIVSSETVFNVSAASTAFTSGAGTIPGTAVRYLVGGTNYDSTEAAVSIGHASPLATTIKLVLPADAKAGTYAGTVTFTASN